MVFLRTEYQKYSISEYGWQCSMLTGYVNKIFNDKYGLCTLPGWANIDKKP